MTSEKPLHIVWVLANNSTAPYFSWFAARAQHEKNIRFSFVALFPTEPAMVKEMAAFGCKVYWIPFNYLERKSGMMKAIPKLYRLFRKLKPDVVHAHLFDDAFPSLLAARIAGVPVRVITKGDSGFHWHFAPKGVRFDKWNNRNATHIVAVSTENRDFILEKEKADPQKVYLIHHGIPPSSTAQAEETKQKLRERLGISPGDTIIGTVSRFISWKGYAHIIDAAKIVVKQFPEVKFMFTGRGEEREEIEKRIAGYGLRQHIIFTGWIEPADMPSLYGLMDIYLHAATLEPFGFVIAEALMNGVPVVSVSTGAARDAIQDGENGFLVDKPSGPALAGQLLNLLLKSPDERREMGAKGKKSAEEHYTFERMWEKHIDLYRNAIHSLNY